MVKDLVGQVWFVEPGAVDKRVSTKTLATALNICE
jgi:hypothetical protein